MMVRFRSFVVAVAMAVLLAGTPAVWAQQDFSQVQVTATRVAGNVVMLEGSGGNIGILLSPDGTLMVDAQYAGMAPKIRAALSELGTGDPKLLINTHWHRDHTDGNRAFGPQVPILAHTRVRQRLAVDQDLGGRQVPALPAAALPTITFDQEVALHFGGEAVRVVHFPGGHTDGDAVVFFPGSRVIHMGDLMFAGRFPYVDLDSGGDVEGYARNVAAVLQELPADARVIPGHGPLSTVDDLRRFHRMMVECIEMVREKMARGATLEAIITEGVAEEWQGWTWRFISTERWLETIHTSLARNAPRAR